VRSLVGVGQTELDAALPFRFSISFSLDAKAVIAYKKSRLPLADSRCGRRKLLAARKLRQHRRM
jgi:hypothetical protein